MARYTTEQYNALCAAIAEGASFVKYGDKEVRYTSLQEMMQVRAEMEHELGLRSRKRRRTVGVYDKGLAGNRVGMGGSRLPVALPVSSTKNDTFTVYIKDVPGSDTITLRSGMVIAKEYVRGDKLTIPYLKSAGVYVLLPFYVNNEVRQDISYVQNSGEVIKPGGATWNDGDYITIQIEVNG